MIGWMPFSLRRTFKYVVISEKSLQLIFRSSVMNFLVKIYSETFSTRCNHRLSKILLSKEFWTSYRLWMLNKCVRKTFSEPKLYVSVNVRYVSMKEKFRWGSAIQKKCEYRSTPFPTHPDSNGSNFRHCK